MSAPCNACPLEFRSADPQLGIPQGVPISLGICCSKKVFPKAPPNTVLVEVFYVYSGK